MLYRISIVIFLLTLPIISWSQENDSLVKKEFESIFGTPCNADTISESLGNDWLIVLYSNEGAVRLYRKNRIKWEVQIDNFESMTNLCMITNHNVTGRKPTGYVAVFGSQDNDKKSKIVINLKNGRILAQ